MTTTEHLETSAAHAPDAPPTPGMAKRPAAGWTSRLPRWLRVAVGVLVVLAGIAMLVLPGPGLVAILVGLKILAHDIPVAARAEHAVSERIKLEARKAKERARNHRRR